MRQKKNETGAVTIFAVLVLSVLLVFAGLLADLGRIKIAQNRLRRVADSAARSVMSRYDAGINKDYRLFGLAAQDEEQVFRRFLKENLAPPDNGASDLIRFRLEDAGLYLTRPLDRPEVFREQILEAVKYRAPVEIIRNLAEKFTPARSLAQRFRGEAGTGDADARVGAELDNIGRYNRTIEQNRKAIREKKDEIEALDREIADLQTESAPEAAREQAARLEAAKADRAAEAAALQDEIDRLSAATEEARIRIEQACREGTAPEPGSPDAANLEPPGPDAADLVPPALDGESRAHRQNLLDAIQTLRAGDDRVGSLLDPNPAGLVPFGQISGFLALLSGKLDLQEAAVNVRDEIFINEYALMQFAAYTDAAQASGPPLAAGSGGEGAGSRTEVEYICFGGDFPLAAAVSQLYLTRFALDAAAYFAYSSVPGDLVVRSLYALFMGALEGAADTYKLMVGRETVPLASVFPNNPLKGLGNLDYADHLRLLLLLNEDETGKLNRMSEIIRNRAGLNLGETYTLANGFVEVSFPMWFFPMTGMKNLPAGPFGTRIENGRCYLTKYVEFGY